MNQTNAFESVDQIVGELKSIATKAFLDGQAIDQTERLIYQQLMKLGHELLSSMISKAGDGDAGPAVEKNGRRYKQLSKRSRRYRSIFGDLRFERFVYGTRVYEAIHAIPIDEHFGLPEHEYSLVLESWVGMLATDTSFHRAVERLDAVLGIKVPIDSAERIEGRLGKSAASVLEHQPAIDRDIEAEILVQTSDNKGIPMVRPVRDSKPMGAPLERMGPEPDKKQMACMAGVYTVPKNPRSPKQIIDSLFRIPPQNKEERIDATPRNPRYFAAITRHDSTGKTIGLTAEEKAQQWMTMNTIRRHHSGQTIVVMHDGQPSLWNCEAAYQEGWDTVEILDLLHVLPRIWASAKIIRPDAVESFVKEQLQLLLSGSFKLMISPLKNHLRRKDVSRANELELRRIIGYFETNQNRMKYNEYLSAGLPIATGFIEGACRHVIKDRMEQSGMRWKEKGAESLLNLRCIDASGLWELTIKHHQVVSLSKYGKQRRNYSECFMSMAA
jgi:hypothetical protein